MTKHEFISKNLPIIKTLFKSGDISTKVMTEYRIYHVWLSNKGINGKMQRYQSTAEDERCSTRTVIRAVKNMTKRI